MGIITDKKIVLCSLSSKYVHSSLAPWCLAAGIRKFSREKCEYKVIEGTINEPIDVVAKRITDEKPDIIGLSCYIWNINSVATLGALLRASLPNASIILGGPEVSYNAKDVLIQYPWCDYILSGEGEYPFAVLCDSLISGKKLNVPGLCFRNGNEITISEPYVGVAEPPSPYCDEYFRALGGRISYLETSRGCPFSCAFCLSGRCGGIRFFRTERAKEEILLLAKSGTQTVKFIDRTFNASRDRSKKIWRFIIENYGKEIPAGVCFHFEIAGDILDDESIEILNSAPKGSIQLEIGLQSFNEKTLAYINRKTNTEKLRENIRRLVAPKNIHIHIDLIAGLPYEDISSFSESFNTAFELRPDMLQLGFLKLLHGAAMREEHEKYPCVFSEKAPYEVISTPWTDENDLSLLHKTEDALERLYNSGRFLETLQYVLSASGLSAFDFFNKFGIYAAENCNAFVSLDEYTEIAFRYMSSLPGINTSVLRDKMICDRLCSNSSGKLPDVLKVTNPEIKKIRIAIESEETNLRKPGIKRGFALLESEKAAVFSDYENKDPVTGKYVLKKVYY